MVPKLPFFYTKQSKQGRFTCEFCVQFAWGAMRSPQTPICQLPAIGSLLWEIIGNKNLFELIPDTSRNDILLFVHTPICLAISVGFNSNLFKDLLLWEMHMVLQNIYYFSYFCVRFIEEWFDIVHPRSYGILTNGYHFNPQDLSFNC